MAGGRGTRLETDCEKPLYSLASQPLIDHVLDALADSEADRIAVATSPATPATASHVDGPTIRTAGEGYVADLDEALADERLEGPTLTVAADLPLLSGSVIDRVIAAHDTGSLTVAVPVALKRDLGVSIDTRFQHEGRAVAPAGVNVVADGPDRTFVFDEPRLAVNVNRAGDAAAARECLRPDA